MDILDCRVCNRRRIKCDRATPSCNKCIKKKLTCPGYGVILNWEWGVASRGKLARKTIPSLSPVTASSSGTSDGLPSIASTPSSIDVEDSDPLPVMQNMVPAQVSEALHDALVMTEEIESSERSNQYPEQDSLVDRSTVYYKPGLHIRINPTAYPTSGILQDSTSRFLFHHYGTIIAPSMVWVDCLENQWRTIIMPMALHSTPLLVSVLAFAAEHLSALLPDDQISGNPYSRRQNAYRDRALRLLASDMRSDAITSGVIPTSETTLSYRNNITNSVLASILVLCNLETVRPGM
jgi:hypothetical protein